MATKKTKTEAINLKNGKEAIMLVYHDLRETMLLLRALEHDIRKDIIRMLDESEKMTVTDIYIKLRIEQSVASQHLAILRNAGVVSDDRNGKNIYYTLNKARLKEIASLVQKLG